MSIMGKPRWSRRSPASTPTACRRKKRAGSRSTLDFAHLDLPGVSLGLIDVPGHEDFIRNMIAGLGAIDLALLVVAADDGWMPQTEEHWQILNYLGVRRVVVAITKCDLGDAARTEAAVREKLGSHSLGEIPIVLTSVRTGTGLEELKRTLAEVSDTLPAAPDHGKPRLFVDRVFTVRGTGTVVTGTLTGGQLRQGDNVLLQPQKLRARVRALQSHNQPLEIALPATRTALNLPDLRVEEIPRGTVLTTVETAEASCTIDVLIERAALSPRPLKNASVIQMHYGSARFTARITLLDRRELLAGEKAIARLRCTKPAFVFVGDRFILRDSSGRATIAGGVVLNPDADGTKFRSTTEKEFLQARAAAPNDVVNLVRSQLVRDRVVQRASLLVKSNFSEATIAAAIERLVQDGEAFVHDAIVADSSWWRTLRDRAMAAIDAEHCCASGARRAGSGRIAHSHFARRSGIAPGTHRRSLCAGIFLRTGRNPAPQSSSFASARFSGSRREDSRGAGAATFRSTSAQGAGHRCKGSTSASLPHRDRRGHGHQRGLDPLGRCFCADEVADRPVIA